MQGPQRVSDPSRIIRDRTRRTSEDDDDFSLLFHLKSTFLPYFERAMALAERYRLFDLVHYIFGDVTRNQPRRPRSILNLRETIRKCSHPAHKNLEKAMIVREIPVRSFELIMERDYKDAKAGEVAKANYSMNSIFVKRLVDIESKAPSDILLKLLTYQEWVEMLLKLNKSLIKNMKELEKEVCLRMKEMKEVDKAVSEEMAKHCHDIGCLIRFIREAYFKGIWNLDSLNLKTIPSSRVLEKSSRIVIYQPT